MNVDIYLRKSRMEEQSDLAETLKRHKDTLYAIADSMGLNVNQVFEEVVSGESLYARPQMLALLKKVETGGVDAVLCMDIDRLGRGGMRDQGAILEVFKYSNTKIITPDHTYDLNDESDEQLTEFKSFIARQEYKQITKRFRAGKMKSIKEGCFMSPAPFGYRNAVRDKKPTLEIYEDEAKYVRMIFDMYNQGIGCVSIAAALNALNVKPHRSDQFSRMSIRHILTNPAYTGKVVWDRRKHIRKGTRGNAKHIEIYQPEDKWIVSEGLHPPIISVEQFNKVQGLMREHYIPPSNDGTIKSPLAGLIQCGNCGRNMQRQPMRREVDYLMCNKQGCSAGVKYQFVEDTILRNLKDKLRELRSNAPIKDNNDRYVDIYERIKAEITKVLKQKDNLHTLLEQGVYDVATYRERMKSITDTLDMLQDQERLAADAVEKHRRMERSELAGKIAYVLDAYNAGDAKARNQLLKSVIDSISYYKEKKSKPADFELEINYR